MHNFIIVNKVAQAISFLLLEFKELPTGDFLFHNEYFRTMFVIYFHFPRNFFKIAERRQNLTHFKLLGNINLFRPSDKLIILVKINII